MSDKANWILKNFPVPIITPRLILRPPQIGDGIAINEAVLESFENLRTFMLWAQHKPTIDESETYARIGAANWILKKKSKTFSTFTYVLQRNKYICWQCRIP